MQDHKLQANALTRARERARCLCERGSACKREHPHGQHSNAIDGVNIRSARARLL